jgi:signal transduction histidine kinase
MPRITPTLLRAAHADDGTLLEAELLHEMRHPLFGIKAGLELLSRSLGTQLTGLDDFRLVSSQVARLEELLRTWQDLFASPLSGTATFSVEPVVSRALDLFGHRLRAFGDRFSYVPHAQAMGHGIPQALLHATSNVVANALDEAERTEGRLLVRVLDGEEQVEVRVSDEGSGIVAANRERIFEPRFTTKERGSGLGLYIAHSLMERSGGRVWLVGEDDPSRAAWASTEFAISLPKERS